MESDRSASVEVRAQAADSFVSNRQKTSSRFPVQAVYDRALGRAGRPVERGGRNRTVKMRMGVLFAAVLLAVGVLAGVAAASTADTGTDGITCTWTWNVGTGSFTCHNAAGDTLSCTATWTFRPFGYSLTCTLPDGTVRTIHWP
jgi:hypothetical protein